MSSFHQQGFSARFSAMGDEAEAVYSDVFPKSVRFGLKRPEFSVTKMPLKMRYAPDFEHSNGLDEVMGLGRDGTLKTKIEKIQALILWDADFPVQLFVYDKTNQRWTIGPLDLWIDSMWRCGDYDTFEDNGRPYIALHIDSFPYEWTPL